MVPVVLEGQLRHLVLQMTNHVINSNSFLAVFNLEFFLDMIGLGDFIRHCVDTRGFTAELVLVFFNNSGNFGFVLFPNFFNI